MPVDMELEMVLRPPQLPMAPYPAKVITLANGKRMVVRQAEREDVPMILKSVHPCLFIERDYYDIVSARLYGELLAWYRYRVKSEYCLLGQVDGFLVGIVNGRLETDKVLWQCQRTSETSQSDAQLVPLFLQLDGSASDAGHASHATAATLKRLIFRVVVISMG